MLRSPVPLDLSLTSPNYLNLHCPSPLRTPPPTRSGPPTPRLLPSQLATAYSNTSDNRKRPFRSETSFTPTPSVGASSQRPIKRVRIIENNGGGRSVISGVAPLESVVESSTPVVADKMEVDMTMGMVANDKVDQYPETKQAVLESIEPVPDFDSKQIHSQSMFSSLQSRSANSSPPNLASRLQLKRPNLKKLSLSLPSSLAAPSPSISTPSTVCPTPTFSNNTESDSRFSTPYTPGPPKTPALAMSVGRSATGGLRRPSLLSLITQPPAGDDDVPPTPSAGSHAYPSLLSMRGKMRGRSQTAAGEFSRVDPSKGVSKSAFPLSLSFPVIDEIDSQASGSSSQGLGVPVHSMLSTSPMSQTTASPTTSFSASTSASGSTSTTPSTSPPLPASFTFSMPMSFPARPSEPYEDGPIEFLPGVFIGAEESVHQFERWAKGKSRVRIVNVAQEIDDPFDPVNASSIPGWAFGSGKGKGKEKMKMATYPSTEEGRPDVEYCHARWSHGELGLADLPENARLEDVLEGRAPETSEMWKFWDAIRWMEEGRRAGVPVLIHCQCGVSRSATLAIAYTMALAATGAMPELLGHIRAMQEAYDFVKSKSSWIGPNHSLVFQLVDFARNLSTLLQKYHLSPDSKRIQTSFPITLDVELSEAEWARRRREFEESEDGSTGSGSEVECMSPEEANDEARRLDEAMCIRRAMK
ncbi:hypothetical protein CI109_106410 [Kwoniella shandongensis]|uniref:protein-tyrosine-phosphatase n=1 Tax=Kwoniella shandongensis TaxID=1734106 RepID=A0A5M6C131_9TREE|nr:uncharacterized protein CI109_002593 [Kwoniella shandongensis]KAA5528836.1 hypothetical protein CI109_002593 [Kwoniella shandongensis]